MNRLKCLAVITVMTVVIIILSSCPSLEEFIPHDQTPEYSIIVQPKPANGEIRLSHSKTIQGTRIRVYILPDSGYTLKYDSQTYQFPRMPSGRIEVIPKFNYYYEFSLMPYDAQVTAVFERNTDVSKVTVAMDKNIRNGYIVPDVTLGSAGDRVQLYIFPDTGYILDTDSFVVKDAQTGTAITGLTVTPALPHIFTLPNKDVIVSAQFKTADFHGLFVNAQSYLAAGQYDTAASYYSEAFKKRSDAKTAELNEVIFYHSIGKLAGILLENKVREMLGRGKERLHFYTVPATLENWICDSDSGWLGTNEDRWYRTYKGIDYSINDRGEKGYEAEYPPLWRPSTEVSDELVFPKFEVRDGINRENTINNPHGGFFGSFPDMLLNNDNVGSRQMVFSQIFWILLSQNRDQGFNNLLEKLETNLFGTTFEDAAKIAETLPANARIPLYPNLKNRFNLDKYYGTGTITVGKAELDYIFGALRMVKASLQYLRAYDWNMDLRPWLTDDISAAWGLFDMLDKAFQFSNMSGSIYAEYWASTTSINKILPIKNALLTTRNSGNISKAKTEFSKALTMINSSMNTWHGSSGNFSSQAKTDYVWVKNAFAQAKTAIDGNGNFNFPKKLPKPGGAWPSANNSDYAVNMEKFFTVGIFNLRNIFTMEPGGVQAPSMYKIPWYDGSNQTVVLLPNNAERVTVAIPDDDSFTAPGRTSKTWFGLYSMELNTKYLRELFPRGFEQSKYSGRTADTAYFYEVFPTIPLWPERPTYLIGPGEGNKSAQFLYKYYHNLR